MMPCMLKEGNYNTLTLFENAKDVAVRPSEFCIASLRYWISTVRARNQANHWTFGRKSMTKASLNTQCARSPAERDLEHAKGPPPQTFRWSRSHSWAPQTRLGTRWKLCRLVLSVETHNKLAKWSMPSGIVLELRHPALLTWTPSLIPSQRTRQNMADKTRFPIPTLVYLGPGL